MNSGKRINVTARAAGGFVVWMAMTAFPCDAAFVDRTAQLGLSLHQHQASWGDYNNDGYPDINSAGVWLNDGGTNFTVGSDYGYSVWGDYNNDGYLDLFSFSGAVQRNVSGVSFVTETVPPLPGSDVRGACWVDLDNDTFLDVYAGGYEFGGQLADGVVSNDHGTNFVISWQEPIVAAYGVHFAGRGVTACDFDEDGDMDVYVSNYRLDANYLWLNNGSGGLTDVATTYGVAGDYNGYRISYGHTIGSAWGDMNNDGHIDLFVGNFSHASADQDRARFYENDGPPNYHFTERTVFSGADRLESYSSPALGDYDNDGDLDLYFTTIYSGENSRLYRNDGNWVFTDVTAAEGLSGLAETYQAAWADYDNDGDLDLVTDAKLFENQGNGNHWLKVHLKGNATTVNMSAIGAQVRIDLGGGTILSRQVEGSTGEGNQNDLTLHFGLGSHTDPVDLEIVWPDGSIQSVSNVAVDGRVDVGMQPEVVNSGVTEITLDSATINGILSASGDSTDVAIYWGALDGGETTNWENTVWLPGRSAGSFATNVSGLSPNSLYYYRCYATNAQGEGWAASSDMFSTAGGLPFTETFEARSLGALDGQNGWRAEPPQAALVSGGGQGIGTMSCHFASSGKVWHAFAGAGRTNVVWIDMYMIPGSNALSLLTSDLSGATIVWHADPDTGQILVYDGSTRATLQGCVVPSSTWVRFTVRGDYAARTWDLWMNASNVARNLGFYDPTVSAYSELRALDAGGASLDNVRISENPPPGIPFIDDDSDGLDDDWEYFYFGSTTNTAGTAGEDWDNDGFSDLDEFLAGTDPTDMFSTPSGLPFTETFEERSLGVLDGQNGWRAEPPQAALVDNGGQGVGTKYCRFDSSGTVWHAFSGAGRTNIVWIDMYMIPGSNALPLLTSDLSGATIIWHADPDTGQIFVYDGTTRATLQCCVVPSSTWVRFTTRGDYAAGTWDLWMNASNVARNLGFYDPSVSAFSELRALDGGGASLDNVRISENRPLDFPFIDADSDGLDDDWEYFYFGSTTNTAGTAGEDWDNDGFSDLDEFLAGTDPTDETSLFAISSVRSAAGSAVVLRWSSVANMYYAVLESTNLLGGWTPVVSNIAATPPVNTNTVTPPSSPVFYRIQTGI